MEKAQAKGELNEEELRAIEMDVTGQVSNFHNLGISHFRFNDVQFRLCWLRGGVQD